jgi:hypothetical protein
MIADMVGPRNKQVRNGTTTFWGGQHVADQTLAAMQEMERYCAAHPGSPVAVRCPGLSIRGRTFVALLGPTIEEGIAGFGDSVQAALRAFDTQYSRSLARSAAVAPVSKSEQKWSAFSGTSFRRFRRMR